MVVVSTCTLLLRCLEECLPCDKFSCRRYSSPDVYSVSLSGTLACIMCGNTVTCIQFITVSPSSPTDTVKPCLH